MRNLKQIIIDLIYGERKTFLSNASLNYWLRIEDKRKADKGRNTFPKRARVLELVRK